MPKSFTDINLARTIKTTLPVYNCKIEVKVDQKIFLEMVAIAGFAYQSICTVPIKPET